MRKCKHCNRPKPDYGADDTCAMGGRCEWELETAIPEFTGTSGKTTSPIDVPWGEGRGVAGRRLIWSFPNTAIIEGLEVEPLKHQGSVDYNGFIDALRIGMVDYLHIHPYPILMWSPGMPPVHLHLPSVPNGYHLALETRGFYGKIRPRGVVFNP